MPDLADLANFARRLSGKIIPEEIAKLKNEVALHIHEVVVTNTPVDTTEALSNWVVNVGSAFTTHLEPAVKGKGGSTTAASIAITLASARTILAVPIPNVPIYVSNSAPYIESLNNGTISTQNSGFVERALSSADTVVQSYKFDRF